MKIDIGCGEKHLDGFVGIDIIDFGQKYVLDVRDGLPFEDNSIKEVRSEHFLEHLDNQEAINLLNEVWRVLDGEFHVVVPNGLHPKSYLLEHKTYWTEATFKDLEKNNYKIYKLRKWKIEKLVKNRREDIHCWMKPKK